jgi:TPR repeat protein
MKSGSWIRAVTAGVALLVAAAAGAADNPPEAPGNRAALKDLPMAQTAMARTLLFGELAVRNPERGLTLLRSAAESSYAPAEFILGGLLARDEQDTAKWKEGGDYLARAARHGCAGAAGLLGNMLFAATEQHPEVEPVALKFLAAGAEGGDALSQGLLAAAYRRGSPTLAKDLVTAYAWAHVSKNSHPRQPQRMAETAAALETRILGELATPDRERAEKLASDYLIRYGRVDYAFCSQSEDLNKPL